MFLKRKGKNRAVRRKSDRLYGWLNSKYSGMLNNGTQWRILDVFAFIVFSSLTIASIFYVGASPGGELYLEVDTVDGRHYFPMSENTELSVSGPEGNVHIHIEEGDAFVSDADCRDKICVSMGRISRVSGWIACLPNKVFLRVISRGGNSEPEVDAGAF